MIQTKLLVLKKQALAHLERGKTFKTTIHSFS